MNPSNDEFRNKVISTLLLTLLLCANCFAQQDSIKLLRKFPSGFVPSYHIKVHMQNMLLDTYVSNVGVSASQSATDKAGSSSRQRGILIRNEDDSVFKFDYLRGQTYRTTIQDADSMLNIERSIAENAKFSPGGKPTKAISYKVRQLQQLRSLKPVRNLQTTVRTYVSPTNRVWTLYYAKISTLMPGAMDGKKKRASSADPLQFMLFPDAENILVRAEITVNGKQQVVLDLDEAKPESAPVAISSVPSNFLKEVFRKHKDTNKLFRLNIHGGLYYCATII